MRLFKLQFINLNFKPYWHDHGSIQARPFQPCQWCSTLLGDTELSLIFSCASEFDIDLALVVLGFRVRVSTPSLEEGLAVRRVVTC